MFWKKKKEQKWPIRTNARSNLYKSLEDKNNRLKLKELEKEYLAKGLTKEDIERLKILNGEPLENYFLENKVIKKIKSNFQRRLFNESIEHIIGHVEFMGRKFYIDLNTYPTTTEEEHLVNEIIKETQKINAKTIVDMGTSSGSLAITIASEFPNSKVYGVDINPHTYPIFERNRKNHKVENLKFVESNYMDSFPIGVFPDIIFGELPYGRKGRENPSNKDKSTHNMPPQSFHHPAGDFKACQELIRSIEETYYELRVPVILGTGNYTEQEIKKGLDIDWNMEVKYFLNNTYSVTKLWK